MGNQLDVDELDDDRRRGVLLASRAILVRLTIHDALIDLLTGVEVVLDAVSLGAGVRNLDRGCRLLAWQVRAEIQRTRGRLDRPTALAQDVADRCRADKCIVRCLAVRVANESTVAARLLAVAQT